MMHRHVDRYINLHRALGKGFIKHEKSLRKFAAFATDRSDLHITAALILEWAGSAATPNSAQDRYEHARAFAMFLYAEDAQHEVPVAGLFGRSRRRRPAPHILLQDQINGRGVLDPGDERPTLVQGAAQADQQLLVRPDFQPFDIEPAAAFDIAHLGRCRQQGML